MRTRFNETEYVPEKGRAWLPALFCNIIGIAIPVLVIAFMIPLALPQIRGQRTYNIETGSMEPKVPVGSMIIVEDCDPGDLVEGDIIAFSAGETVVAHRVVSNNVLEGKLETKGDANEEKDLEPVDYDQVSGIVSKIMPGAGLAMNFATSTGGRVCLMGMILCGVLFNVLGGRLRKL